MAFKKIVDALPPQGKKLAESLKNWAIYRGGVAGNSVLKPNAYRKAPASHAPPVIPGREDDNIYDITYYSRDFSRNNPLAKGDLTEVDALLDSPQGPNMLIPKQADELVKPSPGRNDPDVARYSRDGLRSTMTATVAARDKRVLQAAPMHLPRPEWGVREEALLAKAEAAGVPAGPGAPFKWKRSAHMHTGRLVEM